MSAMRFATRTPMRLLTFMHEFWYRLTDGWIGGNLMGAPILLLTTTGRRTGGGTRPRSSTWRTATTSS